MEQQLMLVIDSALPLNNIKKKRNLYYSLIKEIDETSKEYINDVENVLSYVYASLLNSIDPYYMDDTAAKNFENSIKNLSKNYRRITEAIERLDERSKADLYSEFFSESALKFERRKQEFYGTIDKKERWDIRDTTIRYYYDYFIKYLNLVQQFAKNSNGETLSLIVLQTLAYLTILWAYLKGKLDEEVLMTAFSEIVTILNRSEAIFPAEEKYEDIAETILNSIKEF